MNQARLLVRASALVTQPWANGGGITRVIAERAGCWRLSLATIAAAGPFSRLPGIVRQFAIVAGCVDLAGDSALFPQRLDGTAAPIAFAGDCAVHAVPQGGPALALNLMQPEHAPPLRLVRSTGERFAAPLALFACAPLTDEDGLPLLAAHDTLIDPGPVAFAGAALAVIA